MNKITRGNLMFLITLLYMICFPYILRNLSKHVSIISHFYRWLPTASTPLYVLITQSLTIFLPIVIYFIVTDATFSQTFPFKKVSIKNIAFIIVICILIQPLMSLLAYFGLVFQPNKLGDIESSLVSYPFLISIFAMAVCPAFFEEIFMRGVIFSNYKRVPVFTAGLINGLFFGIMHRNMQQFFYAWLLGFIFVYFVHYTKSIISSMIAHFFINASQVCLLFIVTIMNKTQGTSIVKQAPNSEQNISALRIFFLLLVVVFCSIFAYLLFKKFISNNKLSLQDPNSEVEEATTQEEFCTEKPYANISFIIIVLVFIFYTIFSIMGNIL